MIATSTQFLDAIRGAHVFAVQATAYPPSGNPVDLPVIDGSVTIDRTADHRRSLSLTLAPVYPSDHALAGDAVYPSATTEPVNVYGTEVIVKRGIRFAGDTTELVQLGVFRIEDVSLDTPGGAVTLTGWDRSRQVLDQRFQKPTTFPKMLATDLITSLIQGVYPGADVQVLTGDTTKIPRHVVDRDRWPEVQRVAQVIGCDVYATETGQWRIEDIPDPATISPSWTVNAGVDGVLIQTSDSVTREGVPNGVIAIGDGPPTVFLTDGFARTVGSGWGTSGSGDDWSIVTGSSGDFDTASSTGRIQAAAGDTKRIQAPVTEDADADATCIIQFPHAISGGDLNASIGLRANSASTNLIRINVTYDNSTGHIIAAAQKVVSGSVTTFGSTKNLGAYTADNQINVRLRLKNNNVKAKAWYTNEPKGWDWDTNQTDVSNAGHVEARLNRGSGNTNSGSPQVTFDNLKVTAVGTWYGIAHDDNPKSPTMWGGDYGHVPVFYTSPHIRSQAQADRIAARQLADILGASRTISFGSVPNPALEAGDAVLVVRPDGTSETHLIDSLEIPLSPSGVMTGETRAKQWENLD